MTTYLSLRNVQNFSATNVTGSTITAPSLGYTSSIVTLGSNAGATKTNFSEGSYAAASWQTAQTGLSANKQVRMSSNGQYQLNVTSPTVYLSTDSGATWSALGTANGLPTGATWLNGSISSSGQYILLADNNGGFLWVSSDYGASFNNSTPTSATPYCWLKFNGDATDTMGTITPTVTGSVTYVTGNTPGTQAVSIANTAGQQSASTQYLRGAWSGATNFTVSFWMNPQSVSSAYYQHVFSAYNGGVIIVIEANGTCRLYTPSGYTVVSSALITNTWYFVTGIFQTNGVCSLYINNNLIGTTINSGGWGTSSGFFELSGSDQNQYFAFNGYIDDFKIINSAITYQNVPIIPPYVWLKFEDPTKTTPAAPPVDSGSAGITPLVTTPSALSYVTGAVGNYAIRLANTAGSTASNYIRGAWTSPASYSVSGWFNVQSYAASGNQFIFTTGGTTGASAVILYIDQPTSIIKLQVPNGPTISTIVAALNTWYSFFITINPSGGTCFLYVNGVPYTTTATATATPSGYFGLGTFDSGAVSSAFNGFIDDFRIYNTAVPFTPMVPMNYNAAAVSGSGQYMTASSATGQLLLSSDYGITWTNQAAACAPQQSQTDLTLSHSGQYMSASTRKILRPNTIAATSTSWSTDNQTWTSSASSNTASSYASFNDTTTDVWTSAATYNTSTGAYTGAVSTTVQAGISAQTGEWLQIQSSTPMVLFGYNFVAGTPGQVPSSYFIVGSNNGTTWYPIQSATMTANPITTTYGRLNTVVQVSLTGVQSLRGDTTGSVTTTSYSYAAGAYTYFRFIANTIWATGASSTVALGEFIPQFITPTIRPQLTGLTANTWAQSGVTYTATSSSNYSTLQPYGAFNNYYGSVGVYSWGSAANYSSTGVYNNTYSMTIQGGIGLVYGDWLQLQLSAPMAMQSYTFACGGYQGLPKNYYIVGSTDGSTWYPVHSCVMTTNPLTSNFQVFSSFIQVNYTGTQTITGNTTGSGTTTAYSYSTTAYTYYRIICTAGYNPSSTLFELGEWFINFSPANSVSNTYGSTWTGTSSTLTPDTSTLSGNGQYQLTASKLLPITWLPFDNSAVDVMGGLTPATGAGTVTYSNTIYKVGTYSAYFNNTAGATSGIIYLNYTLPALLNQPSTLTMACWVYPTSRASYTSPMAFNNGSNNAPLTLYFGSDGTLYSVITSTQSYTSTGYTITTGAIIPLNTWTHLAATYLSGSYIIYVNGIAVYSTSVITGNICLFNGGNMTNLIVGAVHSTAFAYAGYVDDVRLYTSALSAGQISAIYNSQNFFQTYQLSSTYLPPSSTTALTIGSTNATVVAAASSYTGQTMVVVCAETTNNVYYSTNFGSTWTALTIPTSATESLNMCAVSYDGSYLTVGSPTKTFTLNKNASGFALAIGSQAGRFNQGQNAIAIGNMAGLRNQTGSSIVINATGSTMNATQSGFYVAPIAPLASSAPTGTVSVLGYAADCQVVQNSSISFQPATGGLRIVYGNPASITWPTIQGDTNALCLDRSDGGFNTGDIGAMMMFRQLWFNGYTGASSVIPVGGISGVKTNSNGNFGGGLAFHYSPNGTGSLSQGMCLTSGGNVGIGTTAPTALLHVSGRGIFGYTLNSKPGIFIDNADAYGGSPCIQGVTNTFGANNIAINPVGGNVGIGLTNPTYLLQLNSDSAYKPNSGTWTFSSDERLKDNIVLADTDRCIQIIKTVPLKRYTWKEKVYTVDQVNDRSKLGWIAQDVETVFPKAVSAFPFHYNQVYEEITNEDGSKEKKLISEDVIEDCRSLNADQLYAVMYGALQKVIIDKEELQSTVQAQQSSIQSHESTIAVQQSTIAIHESTIQAQQSTQQSQQDTISAHESTIQAQQSSIQAQQSTQQAQQSAITALQEQVSTLTARLDAMSSATQ